MFIYLYRIDGILSQPSLLWTNQAQLPQSLLSTQSCSRLFIIFEASAGFSPVENRLHQLKLPPTEGLRQGALLGPAVLQE